MNKLQHDILYATDSTPALVRQLKWKKIQIVCSATVQSCIYYELLLKTFQNKSSHPLRVYYIRCPEKLYPKLPALIVSMVAVSQPIHLHSPTTCAASLYSKESRVVQVWGKFEGRASCLHRLTKLPLYQRKLQISQFIFFPYLFSYRKGSKK